MNLLKKYTGLWILIGFIANSCLVILDPINITSTNLLEFSKEVRLIAALESNISSIKWDMNKGPASGSPFAGDLLASVELKENLNLSTLVPIEKTHIKSQQLKNWAPLALKNCFISDTTVIGNCLVSLCPTYRADGVFFEDLPNKPWTGFFIVSEKEKKLFLFLTLNRD